MELASILIYSIITITVMAYLWQVIWIFRDCKRRDDDLIWIWCILSLISFPIVLIVYVIFTRHATRGVGVYNSTNNIYSSINRENKCGNCGFLVEDGWRYCPNCKHILRNLYGAKKVNRGFFKSAILIFTVGIIALTAFIIYSVIGIKDSMQKVEVPTNQTLYFKDSGKYTVFYEYNDDIQEQLNNDEVKKLNVTLTDNNTNSIVQIFKVSGKSNYSSIGRGGKSFLEFNIEKPGNYDLDAAYKDNSGGKLTLAIARDFTKRILITVFGSIAILFGTISIGIFIIASSIRKNRE